MTSKSSKSSSKAKDKHTVSVPICIFHSSFIIISLNLAELVASKKTREGPTKKAFAKRPASELELDATPSTKRPAVLDDKENELKEKTDTLRYDFLIFEKLIVGLIFFERRERPNVMDVGSIEPRCLLRLLIVVRRFRVQLHSL